MFFEITNISFITFKQWVKYNGWARRDNVRIHFIAKFWLFAFEVSEQWVYKFCAAVSEHNSSAGDYERTGNEFV